MIKHQIENNKPQHIHNAEVSVFQSEYHRIKRLLAVSDISQYSDDEKEKYGIEEDTSKVVFVADFDDNSELIWRLCSGQTNYYDDVTFKHSNGILEDLDCTFEFDDIEIDCGTDVYRVKINVKEDIDLRMTDERFWEPDEILWNILFKHRGHNVEIATYGKWNNPSDMCLECLDCNEVILDAEIYTICAREDEDK